MPEVSFVLPCLNEEDTLAGCLIEIQECIETNNFDAEILVADNGSTDRSAEIALAHGARVIAVPERGYGSAVRGGFKAAAGHFLVMGDADQSYDFREAAPMIKGLRDGADIVMGSRFKGKIEDGAMPWLHRYVGNPALSAIARVLFRTQVSDFHCGLRAITKEAFNTIGPRTTGMEFATELIGKASLQGMRIDEVPVTLRPDARNRPPHLRTWHDGWRHLRFMMTLSPRWTMLIPGMIISCIGLLLMGMLAAGPVTIGNVRFDLHSMIVGSLFVLTGYQFITMAIAARVFAMSEELGPPSKRAQSAFSRWTFERGLIFGVLLIFLGGALLVGVSIGWARGGFSDLDPVDTARPVIVSVTMIAVGLQTVLMSFLYSMVSIPRSR